MVEKPRPACEKMTAILYIYIIKTKDMHACQESPLINSQLGKTKVNHYFHAQPDISIFFQLDIYA